MLSIYDPLEDVLYFERFRSVPLRHMASELMRDFDYDTTEELQQALNNAFEVCAIMHIPINVHFRKVYIYESNMLRTDWLLSDLGTYLLLINGNTHNPNVARARVAMLNFITKH